MQLLTVLCLEGELLVVCLATCLRYTVFDMLLLISYFSCACVCMCVCICVCVCVCVNLPTGVVL